MTMFHQTGVTYRMDKLEKYSYEMGSFRPPSEGRSGSLLIRASRGCSWNRCKFCISRSRQRPKFEYRKIEEVKKDIDTVKGIFDEIKAASWDLGYGGRVTQEVINAIIQGNPEVYGRGSVGSEELWPRLQCLIHIANWISSGAKTVFLQDSNSLIIRTPDLVELLRCLKESFPTIDRVTTYGRAKTCFKKSFEELKELQEAGLSRIHVGFESGCGEVLKLVDKGVTAEQQIMGGRKVVEAGISLSEYFMPGLGGRKWSQQHVLDSAQALNQINPDFIRVRTFALHRDSPLFEKYETGEFEPLTEEEMVDEIGLLIENLTCSSYLASDHIWNLLMEVDGQLPEDKEKMLEIVREYQAKPPMEKLEYNLRERLKYWNVSDDLQSKRMIREAWESIQNESPEAKVLVEKAILALKQRGG